MIHDALSSAAGCVPAISERKYLRAMQGKIPFSQSRSNDTAQMALMLRKLKLYQNQRRGAGTRAEMWSQL
jgi:hypothetical protein